MRKNKGFTLMELIIVLAIIAVLGTIIVPSILGYVELSKKKATVENGSTIYKKFDNKQAFTLIELIVILAIIGVLGAMLLPSLMGYVENAKKKATVQNGKTIYMSAMLALADEDAYESFYTPQSSWVAYEATADGRVINTTTEYKGVSSTYSEREGNVNSPLKAI